MRLDQFIDTWIPVDEIFHGLEDPSDLVIEINRALVRGTRFKLKAVHLDTLIVDRCVVTPEALALLPWAVPKHLRLFNLDSKCAYALFDGMSQGLEEVDFGDSDVCGSDFAHSSYCSVRKLLLPDSRLSGQIDTLLYSMPNLVSINLSSRDVPLPSIKCLKSMQCLRHLVLAGRDEGLQSFRQIEAALPECEVEG